MQVFVQLYVCIVGIVDTSNLSFVSDVVRKAPVTQTSLSVYNGFVLARFFFLLVVLPGVSIPFCNFYSG